MTIAAPAGRSGLIPVLVLLAALLAAGCTGTVNNAVPYDPVKGHPADFVTTHPTFALRDTSGCTPCHGVDLKGGTSGVSCSAASFNGIACHAGGPGHGTQAWVDNVHFLRAKTNLASCQLCHGADLRGGTSNLSCYAASFGAFGACHTAGPDHLLLAATWVVNDTAVPDTVSAHQAATFADKGASCRPCHAVNPPVDNTLTGGKSGVSCSAATRGALTCHAGGPAFHPASWLDCTFRNQLDPNANYLWHGTASTQNSPRCVNCHDTSSTSQKCSNTCHFTGPKRNPPVLDNTWSHGLANHHQLLIMNSAVQAVCVNCHATYNKFGHQPVCHNCHPPFPGASGHGAGWLQAHAPAARAGTASCAATSGTSTCHGPTLAGGSGTGAGPACAQCHTGEALASHPADCRSCHGNPPPGTPPLTQPAGVFPNIGGAHAKHNALAGVTGNCAVCHTGAGMTSVLHFDTILQVAFATGYNAQSGTFGYTGATTRTCTATICHGGQTTPDWQRTPAALVCTACHRVRVTASPQFNDLVNTAFVQHTSHAGRGCTNCHNMALVNHWGTLTDRAIPAGLARASILSSLNYVPFGSSQSNCTTPSSGCH
ncbi:MAG TPA: CxxxxCH/CxxCH domain-containing protein [Candidatus Deferrimicrobiaceae bacterium]|jgi:predicted CxxxxCH...CXXCH cytochrome family protein